MMGQPDYRLAVMGSPMYPHLGRVRGYIQGLAFDTIVVTDGEPGVGVEVGLEAKRCGLRLETFLVSAEEWHRYGQRARIVRNQRLLQHCEAVTVFWDGASANAFQTLCFADERGMLVTLFRRWDKPECNHPGTNKEYP